MRGETTVEVANSPPMCVCCFTISGTELAVGCASGWSSHGLQCGWATGSPADRGDGFDWTVLGHILDVVGCWAMDARQLGGRIPRGSLSLLGERGWARGRFLGVLGRWRGCREGCGSHKAKEGGSEV